MGRPDAAGRCRGRTTLDGGAVLEGLIRGQAEMSANSLDMVADPGHVLGSTPSILTF